MEEMSVTNVFMKHLDIPLLQQLHSASSMEEISLALNNLSRQRIDNAPWAQYDYIPKVEFSIAHNGDCIFLKYYVEEAVLKAAYYQPDDPVYKDSCVEFFIAFDEDKYYNLEFNAIGTCKLNFGKNRNERIVVAERLVRTINSFSTIRNTDNSFNWELCLRIPIEVFSQHQILSLSGQSYRANFYKCGDDLPTPHYLCWNNIETPEPDFHRPEYFGEVLFL